MKLRSRDPAQPPLLLPNYLDHPEDLATVRITMAPLQCQTEPLPCESRAASAAISSSRPASCSAHFADNARGWRDEMPAVTINQAMAGVRLVRRIARSASLAAVITAELSPDACDDSDAAIAEHVRGCTRHSNVPSRRIRPQTGVRRGVFLSDNLSEIDNIQG